MPTIPRLAIDGGKPIRNTYLPYGRQYLDLDDIKAVMSIKNLNIFEGNEIKIGNFIME